MILLAAMVEAFEGREDLRWLQATAERWRVQACVRDLGFQIEDTWGEAEACAVVALVAAAASELRAKRQFAPGELNDWILLDGMHVDDVTTFDVSIPVTATLDVADALTKLLSDRLPADPPDGWWFFGDTNGTREIPRRER